ncbi:hypothetical protein AcW1_004826 [Taiwanofungus camphoratus]|nr:hypothetical protein AcW2_006168 [Antrodia cinnamomea]KAI0938086.1 hypothetical protein AcV7_003375 [Antrodia cinnamomea]KAI0939981.1 hypothetical protein AcV5_001211 [Antrodia cinnamomea]KAI0960267.1 hypothetical protein AcW1_004826 [Antrodia cinnamomea]
MTAPRTSTDQELGTIFSTGKGTSFYSWLEVPPTASTAEIAKAYRKKSIRLHPDKNRGVKNAHERFARLGVVSTILRNSESRQRYDFFYKNGVPKWRGTGYYYSRFRPGLGATLGFLTTVSSCVQYLVQRMNYQRDLKRIEWIISQAKSAAWGSKMIPATEGQRKVRVNLGGGPRLDDDGNIVGGKMVDMVVEGNEVYILEADGDLLPVNSDTAVPPSLKRTWFLSFLIGLYHRLIKRTGLELESRPVENGDDTDDASATASDVPGSGAATPKEMHAPAKSGRATAAVMAGGRRRKAVRKR